MLDVTLSIFIGKIHAFISWQQHDSSYTKLIKQNRFLDFGFGFYTTTNKEQAIGFAKKVFQRRKVGDCIVNIYEIQEDLAFNECSLLKFESANEAWIDFVAANRQGTYQGKSYDFIFGPVADDDVYTTFSLYTVGVLTKEQTVEALKVKKLFNQLVLTTPKAISYLKFKGTLSKE